jgi:2-polyprenyl-3-methyl-5-hydroxy-6-metoxy-1,4-benzoquinol methylase
VRVRRGARQLVFTLADAPCRLPRHARLAGWHWPMLADQRRARALARGAAAAVERFRAAGVRDVHVLDVGAGCGLLGVLVAR